MVAKWHSSPEPDIFTQFLFPRAIVTKCHKLDGLGQQSLLFHSSGDQNSENQMLAWLFPSKSFSEESVKPFS